MRNWTRVVIAIKPKLQAIYSLIDTKIERLALLSMQNNILIVYNKITDLIKTKDDLITLEVLYEKMKEIMGETDMNFINNYLTKTTEEMIDIYKITRQSIWAKFKRKIKKASQVFAFYNLDKEYMDERYLKMPYIKLEFENIRMEGKR